MKTPFYKYQHKWIKLQLWLNKLIHIISKSKELFSQTYGPHYLHNIIDPVYNRIIFFY